MFLTPSGTAHNLSPAHLPGRQPRCHGCSLQKLGNRLVDRMLALQLARGVVSATNSARGFCFHFQTNLLLLVLYWCKS
jgi:hypothetical protein